MLHSNDLLTIETMPSWSDISLALYKEFSEQYLIPTIFRYYLENGEIIDVRFKEWAIYHILGIQHINGKISKTKFFEEIENRLDLDSFMENKKLKKRLNDFKHRIRMFGCIYQIMKDEELFYIKDKQLKDSSVKADYIKYALIDNKGALPSRQLKLILAWCVLHQDELMQNWKLSKDGKPLNRINPLV